MRIVIGCLTGPQFPKRRKRCLSNWMGSLPIWADAVFLMASPAHPIVERQGRCLFLPCPYDKSHLPANTKWFCRWLLSRTDWDWAMKVDDDCLINMNRLLDAVCGMKAEHYFGRKSRSQADGGFYAPTAYILSRRAVEVIASNMPDMGSEDSLVGNALRQAGITLTETDRFTEYPRNEYDPWTGNRDILTSSRRRDDFE